MHYAVNLINLNANFLIPVKGTSQQTAAKVKTIINLSSWCLSHAKRPLNRESVNKWRLQNEQKQNPSASEDLLKILRPLIAINFFTQENKHTSNWKTVIEIEPNS